MSKGYKLLLWPLFDWKVARNLNAHIETWSLSLKWYKFDEIYLIFTHNSEKCYFKVFLFNEVLKEVWDKGLLKEKEKIKELWTYERGTQEILKR